MIKEYHSKRIIDGKMHITYRLDIDCTKYNLCNGHGNLMFFHEGMAMVKNGFLLFHITHRLDIDCTKYYLCNSHGNLMFFHGGI